MSQIESLSSKEETEPNRFSDIICKIDRILRIFKMVKNYDSTMLNEVRQRVNILIKTLEGVDPERYLKLSQKINKFIQQCLTEQQKKKGESKQGSVSGQSSKGQQKVSSSFGTNNQRNKKQNGYEFQSGSSKSSQAEKITPNRSSNSFESLNQQNLQNSQNQKKKQEGSLSNKQISFDRKQSVSSQLSGSISDPFKVNRNLKQYCENYSTNIQSRLSINQQILTIIKSQNPQKVLLLGVQKPADKNQDKLYISTYMQFTKQQVTSIKFNIKDYQTELQQFSNIIRYPLLLCAIGNSITDMKIHYIKFLLEMTSPTPIVIIFNQSNYDKSIVIRMNEKVVNIIQEANFIQMDKIDSTINMKDKNKYKCVSLKDIHVSKEKIVTTKFIQRKAKYEVIQNCEAILLQKSQKMEKKQEYKEEKKEQKKQQKKEQKQQMKEEKKQSKPENIFPNPNTQTNFPKKDPPIASSQSPPKMLIKQQQPPQQKPTPQPSPQQFNLILHSKFMVNISPQNFVYYISNNNEITTRKKTKSIEQSIQSIKLSQTPCILGYTLKSPDKKIPTDLFTNFMQIGRDKCLMIILRLKTLTLNKIAIITVDPDKVSEQEIKNFNIIFKDIEDKKYGFLRILLSGQKTEVLKYEGKNVMQEI